MDFLESFATLIAEIIFFLIVGVWCLGTVSLWCAWPLIVFGAILGDWVLAGVVAALWVVLLVTMDRDSKGD